jgi:arylsulfatase A-like enzyme
MEAFWSILRGSLRGGIFLTDFTETGQIVYLVLLSLVGCSVLFILFYSILPLLLLKAKRPQVKITALVIVLCFLPKDMSVSHASLEQFTEPVEKPCIVMIVMDTVRVDHLSCYGHKKSTTPHLDRFAQDALLYKNAYATAPWTLPSIASILTGAYPGHHGAHRVTTSDSYYPANKLSDVHSTLPEILQGSEYTTAGVVSCEWLTASFGINRGFNHFNDRIPSYFFTLSTFAVLQFSNHFFPLKDYLFFNGYYGQRIAHQINKAALSWLRSYGKNQPFFLFLHYFDPHHPYFPEHLGTSRGFIPDTIRHRYPLNTANYVDVEGEIINSVLKGEKPLLSDEKSFLLNNYDRDISRLDQKLGELFAALKEMNLYEKTLIIVTSDHGEAFGEHNLMLHGRALFNNNLHVPLLIKYPFNEKRRGIIDCPVSLAGIAPTVLSYLSLEIPDSIQGFPFSQKNQQLLIAQNFHDPHSKEFPHDLISIQQDNYKYIEARGGDDQFYNLKDDPGETRNLITTKSTKKDELRELLHFYSSQLKLVEGKDDPAAVDTKTLQNLKALGYIN